MNALHVASTVLPRYRVTAVTKTGFSSVFERSKWIGENWIGVLVVEDRFVWNRFVDVDTVGLNAAFALQDARETTGLVFGHAYPYLDGYYGARAELVLEQSQTWTRTTFVPRDAIRYDRVAGHILTKLTGENANGGRIVPGGWDHEHCELCSATIGTVDASGGFVNRDDKWVCDNCYERCVATRSLVFIDSGLAAEPESDVEPGGRSPEQ